MRTLAVTLLLTAFALPAADRLPDNASQLLEEYWKNKDPKDLADLTSSSELASYVRERFLREQGVASEADIGRFRFDQLLGNSSVGSGSTSLVKGPSASDLVSAAMESGAFNRKTEKNTVTVHTNALPLFQLLNGQTPTGCGSLKLGCEAGAGRWIRGLSAGVTGNVSGKETPLPAGNGLLGLLTGGGQNLAGVTVRYELFVRERSSGLQKGLDEAAKALSEEAGKVIKSQFDLEAALTAGVAAPGGEWSKATQDKVRSAQSLDEARNFLLEQYAAVYAGMPAVNRTELLTKLVPLRKTYIQKQNAVLADKLYRKAATFDYIYQRPADQPALSQIRLVVSTPLGKKPLEGKLNSTKPGPAVLLNMNSGFTWYQGGNPIAGKGSLRDAQVSSALEIRLGKWGALGNPTATLAGYYQYMFENGVIQFNSEAVTPNGAGITLPKPAIEVLNTAGHIGIGQFRVSVPIGNTGVSFPFAVSYSNRTELITGRPLWQGHVGVTYDLGKLGELLRPKAP